MKEKQTILILGAGSDIAKATSRKFASKGYDVQLAGRDMQQLERLGKDLISRYGVGVSCHIFDAVIFDSHDNFVENLNSIPDIVAYFVGVMYEQKEASNDWNKARATIDANYTGAVSIINLLAKKMLEKGNGCIVGVSSVAGERGRGSNYIYGSAKAAFTAYLSGLRNELFTKGIGVITVKPGFVNTKMTQDLELPPKLTAQPQKVGDAIYNAVVKKKDIIYIKPIWYYIMQIIRMLPEPIFKRMKL
jgi:short-subunit dehydrogenase